MYFPIFRFQIYELLLFYTKHADHNVVTASLETLQQLLRAAPQPLLSVLTSPGSIPATSIYQQDLQHQLLQASGRVESKHPDNPMDNREF